MQEHFTLCAKREWLEHQPWLISSSAPRSLSGGSSAAVETEGEGESSSSMSTSMYSG